MQKQQECSPGGFPGCIHRSVCSRQKSELINASHHRDGKQTPTHVVPLQKGLPWGVPCSSDSAFSATNSQIP